MRLTALFLGFGFLALLLQTSLLHLLPLGPVVPDLTLILCVYLGLYRPTIGAVLGSFALGYSLDVFSSHLLGLNAFAMSLVFLITHLSSRTIWVPNQLWSAPVVFVASWIKAAALIAASSVFLSAQGLWEGVWRYVLAEAFWAAIFAPLVFLVLRRGQSRLEAPRMAL